jgi:hypothetical protein
MLRENLAAQKTGKRAWMAGTSRAWKGLVRRVAVVSAVALAGGGLLVLEHVGTGAATGQPSRVESNTRHTTITPHAVFVCKYVDEPGVAERLQTGQNPIDVDVAAIPEDPVVIGSFFADSQGRSFVLAFDTGQPDPSVSACPTTPSTTTSTPRHCTNSLGLDNPTNKHCRPASGA